MQIIPINFQKRHREMLQWTYILMSKRFTKIYPSLQKLVVFLRTAVVIDDWKLDKQQKAHGDILDSFRLPLCNYGPSKGQAFNHIFFPIFMKEFNIEMRRTNSVRHRCLSMTPYPRFRGL